MKTWITSPRPALGGKKKDIMLFIDQYWIDNWTSPSMSAIAEHVGLASKATVNTHLNDLVRLGYLERKQIDDKEVGPRVLYRRAV